MDDTPEARVETLQRHFDLWSRGHEVPSLVDEWLTLFTDDCSVEEPVGTEVRRGVMRQGWDAGHGPERRIGLEPVHVIASERTAEAATLVRITIEAASGITTVDAIGTWSFADDGRIAGSRIFPAAGDLGPDVWDA